MENQPLMRLRTMPYEEYLQTPEWIEKREQTLERDGHRCRVCNSREKLHVHHRTYARRGNEDLNDLTTLCETCHEEFHQRISQAEVIARTAGNLTPRVPKEVVDQRWEDHLIGILIQHPNVRPHVVGIVYEHDFAGTETRALYHLLLSLSGSDQTFEQVIPQSLLPAFQRAIQAIQKGALSDESALIKEAMQVIIHLRRQYLYRLNLDLKTHMQESATSGDHAALKQAQQQVQEIRQQLRVLNSTRSRSRG